MDWKNDKEDKKIQKNFISKRNQFIHTAGLSKTICIMSLVKTVYERDLGL